MSAVNDTPLLAPLAEASLEAIGRATVADQIYDELCRQVLSLQLRPGTTISEAEVAKALGVSRQPVRDAFYRLSKLGFLLIRPQRGTQVTRISTAAVMEARFIRVALEAETARAAAIGLTGADLAALRANLVLQEKAVAAEDRSLFHKLDDRFHYEICTRAGLGFAWDMIAEHKGHMDRVRMLSLSFGLQAAYDDHLAILAALESRDADAADAALRNHLSRIVVDIVRIRDANRELFAD